MTGLVRSIISSGLGNNKGSYVLTLELLRDDKPIAIQPLINVTYENERFLFVNWSTKTTKDVSLNGNIVLTGVIDETNNQVDVIIKSYFKANSTFDMSLFDQLNEINNSFGIVGAVDPSGIALNALGKLRTALTKVLQDLDHTQEHFRIGMGFTQLGASTNNIRKLTVPIKFTYRRAGQKRNGSLLVNVKTWSISSKFDFDKDKRKFVAPNAFVYLNNVRVGSGADSKSVFDLLRQTGEDQVRSFLKNVFSPAGYQGNDVFSECTNLLANYRKFMSNRDLIALYWATLSEHRGSFKRSHALDCIEGRKSDFIHWVFRLLILLLFSTPRKN